MHQLSADRATTCARLPANQKLTAGHHAEQNPNSPAEMRDKRAYNRARLCAQAKRGAPPHTAAAGCRFDQLYQALNCGNYCTELRMYSLPDLVSPMRQVDLLRLPQFIGNPGFTVGRGFNPAGGAPGGG
ncbi:adenylosuccinate synthetase 2, chloroplastic-like [Dorcoceras hygrometricum]|uniref:Adenylosuccinate synthetase 2, chloroplastic-like n=1 Tax=Dorcoceras hygrometricum TaxID=472368 RepID=A0A2Z7CNT7_9LAMI|nr:adenylosuccinate synthetase 2, chloroplastic-like [Dorcoceras hygrometricum]